MKKKLKKGFTLVELVIVIAVIAILSAVLIPTFGNVISNANDSAAKSEVSNAITQYTTNQASNNQSADLPDGYIILFKSEVNVAGDYSNTYKKENVNYVFSYNKGKLEMVKCTKVEVKTDNTASNPTSHVELTLDGVTSPVKVKCDGLSEVGDNKWKTDGTVVLDGTTSPVTSGSSTTYTLKGKIVLLKTI